MSLQQIFALLPYRGFVKGWALGKLTAKVILPAWFYKAVHTSQNELREWLKWKLPHFFTNVAAETKSVAIGEY